MSRKKLRCVFQSNPAFFCSFEECLYSVSCVIGCGCDNVHSMQYPMVLSSAGPSYCAVNLSDVLGIPRPPIKKDRPRKFPECSPPPNDSIWSTLPAPALAKILSHLSIRNIGRCLQVCR